MSDTIKTKVGEVVLTASQFEAMKTAGTLQEGVTYHISDYSEPVTDVKINGTTIVNSSTGVANIPIGDGVLGALKADSYYQLATDSGGAFYARNNSYSIYSGASDTSFVGKRTLENVLDNESVRFDKSVSLTDSQKLQARTNISAVALEEYNSSATSYADNTLYYVVD